MAKKRRTTAMTQHEIDAFKQTIPSTPKVKRPFVCHQPAGSGEEVQKMIVLTTTNTFGRQEYLTPLAPAKFCHLNFAECTNKMYQAKQYYIIYDGKLISKEM